MRIKSRKSRKPTKRRTAFNQKIREGRQAYASAKAVGYTEATALGKSGAMANQARSEYIGELWAQGITAKFKARKVRQLLDAKMPKWNPEEKEFELFENADIQLRTLQDVNKIEDEYPAPKEFTGDNRPIQIIFPANFSNLTVRTTDG